ncbi:MAG: GNAT family N-acetyltransferase [Candidatus Lokiarchaeota archaeon]|nr:GNAT family N-acetyltransferase [Candidatus Lokiarchaeota archaeon]
MKKNNCDQKRSRIIFRNYEKGDESGLAEVYNYGFQQNGVSPLKTPENWYWRYIKYPDYESKQINIAEDAKTGKIIGSVIGNIEDYFINKKKYSFGVINDVVTYPGYGGRGVATNLMKMALNYFTDKDVDFSVLSADPRGIAREKIYLPLGYKDRHSLYLLFHVTNYRKILRDIPIVFLVLPALSLTKIKPILINYKNKIQSVSQSRSIIYSNEFHAEINHYSASEEFRKRFNEVGYRQFDCFHIYTNKEWEWARVDCDNQMHKPTEITIRDKRSDEIIAGAIIDSYKMYALKFGIEIKMGAVKNLFVDELFVIENLVKEKTNIIKKLKDLYKRLFALVLKASHERNNSLTMFTTDKDFVNGYWGAIHAGFLGIKVAIHMVKEMKKDVSYPNLKKPFYADPGEKHGQW